MLETSKSLIPNTLYRENKEISTDKISKLTEFSQSIFKILSQLFEFICHYTRLLAKGLSIKTKLAGIDLHFNLSNNSLFNVHVYQNCPHLENPHSGNMCLVK